MGNFPYLMMDYLYTVMIASLLRGDTPWRHVFLIHLRAGTANPDLFPATSWLA